MSPSRRNHGQNTHPRFTLLEVGRWPAAGPAGRLIEARVRLEHQVTDDKGKRLAPAKPVKGRRPRRNAGFELAGERLRGEANALILLRRLALVGEATDKARPEEPALEWAQEFRLGYDPVRAEALQARRDHLLRCLRETGKHVLRLRLATEWRLVIGLGEPMADHEFGLHLHGTHGWPLLRGSGLKGAAAAWARHVEAPPEEYRAVFGDPPPTGSQDETAESSDEPADSDDPGGSPAPGGVRFLDALPECAPADGHGLVVHRDVITPHQQPYRTQRDGPQTPPGEHEAPNPQPFLSLSGAFTADLVGDEPEATRKAADWLTAAATEQGLGARTAAGYGYTTVDESVLP
ncbi:type III-B CRISPR module RAMP protein Cmr6 [Nocardiopsis sp. RSe5-2]|uniref:Type III-B CRISPR module RAMP protein Cmr6 n=1 Tax=Nocardiopsis endophytica TaxID=3018445 RepID=A0ABT4U0P9_9ACTN|nr:type III-B CRISPR module RAMP protein Cmr6 [Nocardiopsis endophytica]MDA2810524.1 type III-B CRISPR module RAMP protein Cmr6 [Nocardiopsis endophytica]